MYVYIVLERWCVPEECKQRIFFPDEVITFVFGYDKIAVFYGMIFLFLLNCMAIILFKGGQFEKFKSSNRLFFSIFLEKNYQFVLRNL